MELEFNKIYVLESLFNEETKTGTNLYNDIIRTRMYQLPEYQAELVTINSKLELFKVFERIKIEIENDNVIPLIHFEIHGNPKGFVLNSGESIFWMELHHRFIELNALVNLKIWVSLATCYGAYIYSIIRPTDQAPFYGYIGAWEQIDEDDLSVSFERFFDELLTSFDINIAINQLNLENPRLPVEYKVYHSVDVFNKIYDHYEETMYTPENFKRRVEDLVQQCLTDVRNNQLELPASFFQSHAEKILNEDKEFYKRKYMEHFLLVDMYPENVKRFDL